MKNIFFKKTIGIQSNVANIYNPLFGNRKLYWKNPNLLLVKGYNGAKTGTTNKAGHCLCASIDDPIYPNIITILNQKIVKNDGKLI